jgi:hypothetical protein
MTWVCNLPYMNLFRIGPCFPLNYLPQHSIITVSLSVADPNDFYLDSDSDPQKFFRIRIRIRILWANDLRHIILRFPCNCKCTVNVFSTTKKTCFFSFKSLICQAVLFKCNVWIRIRIRIRILFGFGFGSSKKCRILSDSDPQHWFRCEQTVHS